MADRVTPRREQPAFRVGAYLIFGGLLIVTLAAIGVPPGFGLLIFAVLGGIETIWTTRRMYRRVRPKRIGPRAEWID